MKTLASAAVALLLAAAAFADQPTDELNATKRHKFPSNDQEVHNQATPGGSGNLINHGGQVIPFGRVVYIFWGSSWSPSNSMAVELQSYRNSFYGLQSHLGMLNQYNAQQSNLKGSQ